MTNPYEGLIERAEDELDAIGHTKRATTAHDLLDECLTAIRDLLTVPEDVAGKAAYLRLLAKNTNERRLAKDRRQFNEAADMLERLAAGRTEIDDEEVAAAVDQLRKGTRLITRDEYADLITRLYHQTRYKDEVIEQRNTMCSDYYQKLKLAERQRDEALRLSEQAVNYLLAADSSYHAESVADEVERIRALGDSDD